MNLEARRNHAVDETATGETRSQVSSWIRWAMVCLIAIVVIVTDQCTKIWIRSWLPLGSSQRILDGILWFTHVQNPGGAFGLFPNAPYVFLAGAVIVLVLFIIWGRQAIQQHWLAGIALGLLLGGGIGNSIDRVIYGYVTDFIDVRVWPVFNIADSALSIGAALIALFIWFHERH